jgi:pimeloyl-ACP methyl ester carboxylesterase
VEGLALHYKRQGQGEPTLMLLHGFGASVFSWREVLTPLAERGTAIAFDRPAFGLTERPVPGAWQGTNPYSAEAQVALTVGLMDRLDVDRAILIGHSAGGTVAIQTALEHPERVPALILVAPAVYTEGGTALGWLRPLLRTPQMRRLGPLLVRSISVEGQETLRRAWHDPSQITPEVVAGYREPLRAENWDRALWELTAARRSTDIESQLDTLQIPTLVITGDDDRIVPTAQSVRLSRELPDAELVVIPDCGHVPHEECPEAFLRAVEDFLARLP